MSNILQKTLAVKAGGVAVVRKHRDLASMRAEAEVNRTDSTFGARDFARAMRDKIAAGNAAVIAEVKKASPSKGVLRPNFKSTGITCSYAEHGAACLLVLADEQFFQGHVGYLREARAACTLPVLRKDFMVDLCQVYEARSWGADCVLLIVAALDQGLMEELETYALELGSDVLVGVHDGHELDHVLCLQTPLVGVNNRNPRTFETSPDNTLGLPKHMPDDRIVVTESDILTPDDAYKMRAAAANAFLVGEAFMRTDDPGAELARLFA